jgi:EAL domain-containing protein (putative c-di-GMP-specific phosphodiesterase class I)
MPVDFLKIDKSFVSGKEHADKEIVTAIINLSERLGLNVIAEGVETKDQLELIRALNCGFAQGYYFSRPVAARKAMALPARFK